MAAHAQGPGVPMDQLCALLMDVLDTEDHDMPLTDAQMAARCGVALVELRAARRLLDVPASQGRRKRYRDATGEPARASSIPTDAEIDLQEARRLKSLQDEEFLKSAREDAARSQAEAARKLEMEQLEQQRREQRQRARRQAELEAEREAETQARRHAKGKGRAIPQKPTSRDDLRRARLRALCPEQLGQLEEDLRARGMASF